MKCIFDLHSGIRTMKIHSLASTFDWLNEWWLVPTTRFFALPQVIQLSLLATTKTQVRGHQLVWLHVYMVISQARFKSVKISESCRGTLRNSTSAPGWVCAGWVPKVSRKSFAPIRGLLAGFWQTLSVGLVSGVHRGQRHQSIIRSTIFSARTRCMLAYGRCARERQT
eukprot:COSAG02_NODE_8971_length_2378_cov_1.838964_2_plen_168_part_00